MNWYLKVLKQYADFKGRSRRKEYWMFSLISIAITYGITIIAVIIEIPALATIGSIYSLAVLIPRIAVGVRRMHDVGKSGWFLLIPIYNFILAVSDSEAGANKWGENPKTGSDEINQIGVE